ncbi:UDP-glucose dehydrogenase family protein [Paraburkholderia hospita]|jgi:UDPglucose 6-dehydrogenase|uniref:UDP-glucose 6-dehydrogenase n=1 Tax=Paraburkholderia hospita TaxID=169430 RepID=A0AAN1JCZ9_9BURK|nr:UDP-glucose/GDP-mannose dehydrogenase family protein [Paraburkholderia hospita]SKC91904.1 nucleotide sugar dehydrogenase [Burkholderia sp. CF099]SOE86666.1 nucleotide sugar dehydrogenase [Burkholderia sp. YR290]AUT71849.1 UDP-glucose/GDP-mannose dehydrogenase family protein [Paraburkholderia hospita]EIM94781.1 UDP-glucose 6-dehydrogenase [Paraburkholderia hospita]OUL80730.1 UDP-glucose 6-dehydrogenase [Paraburkholderia hospita]
MKVTVIGSGYVGLVTGACLADIGNEVVCVDIDRKKVDTLLSGGVPIYEPGLKDVMDRNRQAMRLKFTTDMDVGVAHGDVLFIAVGTPPDEDGSADLTHVIDVAREVGRRIDGFQVVVNKSTVPVGTASRVKEVIASELAARGVQASFSVVSNPEFLKEGAAVEDFMRPDRIVIGSEADEAGLRARAVMRELYSPFNRNHDRTLHMDVPSAEFTKYAANAMLATRISFMNELANLAERLGADIESVRRGIGSDPRIGYDFLYAGVGYGGSCFPKDVNALRHSASQQQYSMQILDAVTAVNESQRSVLLEKIYQRFGRDLTGYAFAVWGLAFKPNTDDMREAPSRPIIAALLRHGATVQAYDPVAMPEARKSLTSDLGSEPSALNRLRFVADQDTALEHADALVTLTEWKSFKSPDFDVLVRQMKRPVIFDGRNLYEPSVLDRSGIEYYGIGRGL